MAQDISNLIWIDMEMSGLSPQTDRILEVALVITNSGLDTIAEAPVLVISQTDAVLDAMDSWNKSTHAKSGLIDKVRSSVLTEEAVEQRMITFLQDHVPAGISPMCGNSICQDRRFLHRQMPALEKHFHYRNLDVSTLKELARRWAPQVLAGLRKHAAHTALSDVRDSIAELAYYRQHMGTLAGLDGTKPPV